MVTKAVRCSAVVFEKELLTNWNGLYESVVGIVTSVKCGKGKRKIFSTQVRGRPGQTKAVLSPSYDGTTHTLHVFNSWRVNLSIP